MAEFKLIENDLRLLAVVDTTEKHGLVITAAYPEDQVGLTPEQAHLIAAAPEMYEALKGMCEFWELLDERFPDLNTDGISGFNGVSDYVGRARQALAKVEGNSER